MRRFARIAQVRALALMLIPLLVSSSVSGCAETATTPGSRKVTVFAAASLRQSFTEIGERFQAANPAAHVEFSFAGSADLLAQLTQGAAADVFAPADVTTMDTAGQANLLADPPVSIAANTLTIAVAAGNPKNIASLADLTRPGLAVVVCAPQVPCGSAAAKVQQAAGVRLDPVSEESQVTDVLQKVTSGQADAGLVYVTDVLGAGDRVTGVAFPEADTAVNVYPIAVLRQSRDLDLARRFVDFVAGADGQRILGAAGFAKP